MSHDLSKKISIISGVFLFALAMFGYGVAVSSFKIWPFQPIQSMYSAALSIFRYGELVPANRLIKAPDYLSRDIFSVYQQEKVQPGYYALMGFDGKNNRYAAWLLDDSGRKIHYWDLSYLPLDSDGPLNGSDAPHAFKLLPDGSLIVNFDSGDVMARIDRCSKPVWTKSGVYHHSLEQAGDGSFWTWLGDNTAYAHYNYLENFDPYTGKAIRSIGLIEDLIVAQTSATNVFAVRADYPFRKFDKTPANKSTVDLFHPNDIDVLQPEIAEQFANFETGDLLLSFRNIHLVVVVDPDDHKIKWWRAGPWKFQHDPDFTADGKISVYSNNTYFGRSEIIKIDPVSGEVFNELENGDLFFYSKYQGKHQYLPNGNLLIVSPDEGRVIQVTASGDKVFEYNNVSVISSAYNEHIANAIWLADDYFSAIPGCDTLSKETN